MSGGGLGGAVFTTSENLRAVAGIGTVGAYAARNSDVVNARVVGPGGADPRLRAFGGPHVAFGGAHVRFEGALRKLPGAGHSLPGIVLIFREFDPSNVRCLSCALDADRCVRRPH